VNLSPQAVKEHCSWLVAGHDYVPADGPRSRRATPWSSHGALLIEVYGVDLAEVGATVAELIDTIEGCGDAAFRLKPGGTASDRRVSGLGTGGTQKRVGQAPSCRCPSARVAGLKPPERPFGGDACAQP
jgi:hypothetical protein